MIQKTKITLCNGRTVNGEMHLTVSGDFVFYAVPMSTLRRHYGYDGAMKCSRALDGRELVVDVLV